MSKLRKLKYNEYRVYYNNHSHIIYKTEKKWKKFKENKIYVPKKRGWFIREELKKKEISKEKNILLLISIGDYKHVDFDIILKRIFDPEDFKNLVNRSKSVESAHERIKNETIDMAAAKLRNNGHFGLAAMLKNNEEVDYVKGGEYTWTEEQPCDVEFVRFDIRKQNRLKEINTKRVTEYKKQKKLDDENGNK